MKKLFIALTFLPSLLQAYQQAPKPAPGNTATLVCKIINLPSPADSLYLFEPAGLGRRVVARSARRMPDSVWVITVPAGKPKLYAFGAKSGNVAKVVLGEEKEITIWGNYEFMERSRTVGSSVNKAVEIVMKRAEKLREEGDRYLMESLQFTNNDKKSSLDKLAQINTEKRNLVDSLKKANPLAGRIAAANIHPDFMGQEGYGNSLEFFAKEYFRFADFKDPLYADVPDVFPAFERFTARLASAVITADQMKQMIDAQLSKIPENSRTYRMALSGIVNSLKNANHMHFPTYANQYLSKYRNDNLGEIPTLEFEMRRLSTALPGFEAPDLVGMTPDSSTFSLKQMRGKVVLIDFWASWCGPCRRENPNVVATYNKYKDKGFDILGVSLDREINAWRNAIKQDGLPWRHISDLGGWQSKHANMYMVSSIPATVLLDREGKIISRNLRGEALGEKLKEIFGE